MHFVPLGNNHELIIKIKQFFNSYPSLPFDNILEINETNILKLLKESNMSPLIPLNFLNKLKYFGEKENQSIFLDEIYKFKILVKNNQVYNKKIKDSFLHNIVDGYKTQFENLYKILHSEERIHFIYLQSKGSLDPKFVRNVYNLFEDSSLVSFTYLTFNDLLIFDYNWFSQFKISEKDFKKVKIWKKIFNISEYRTVITTDFNFILQDRFELYDKLLLDKYKKILKWKEKNKLNLKFCKIWKGHNNEFLIRLEGDEKNINWKISNCVVYLNKELIFPKKKEYINTKLGPYYFSIYPHSFTQTNIFESYFLYNYTYNFIKKIESKINQIVVYGRNSHHIAAFLNKIKIPMKYFCQKESAIKDILTTKKLNNLDTPDECYIFKEHQNLFYNEISKKDTILILTPGPQGFKNFNLINSSQMIYISCNFYNLKRDLSENNYSIIEQKFFNILPQTSTSIDFLYLKNQDSSSLDLKIPMEMGIKKSFDQPLINLDYHKQIITKEKYYGNKIICSDKNLKYRNTLKLEIKNGILGGFVKSNNKYYFTKIALKNILPIVTSILESFIKNSDIKLLESLEGIHIRGSESNNESLTLLFTNTDIDSKILSTFLENYTCPNVCLNTNGNMEIIKGKDFITESILSLQFKISANSFFQINRNVCIKLYQKIREIIKRYNSKNLYLWDLYSGTGTIGITCADLFKEVLSIEYCQNATKDANYNAKVNKINNIKFTNGKVENLINYTEKECIIIANPPRGGLHKNVIDVLNKIPNVKALILIHCSYDRYDKNKRNLISYQEKEKYLFDMFPNTFDIETLSVYNKKEYCVSLGFNCSIAYHIKNLLPNQPRYPFDWLKNNKMEINLNTIKDCYIEGGLPEYFLKDLVFKKISDKFPNFDNNNDQKLYSFIFENKYTSFYHDFYGTKDLDPQIILKSQFPLVKQKYERRFKRLYEILTNGSKVKFIGLQATNIVDKEHVLSFLNFFKNVKLVYFSAKEIIELDHPNFYCYKIEKSKDWKYDNLEWNSILSVDN